MVTAAILTVQNDALDGLEYNGDVVRVRGGGRVRINHAIRVLVATYKLLFDELHASLEVGVGGVLAETDIERRGFDLLLEQIGFVEEENDVGLDEPLVVHNLFEQLERLVHAIHLVVLLQHGAVRAHVRAEDHARHALKAVDPATRPLASMTRANPPGYSPLLALSALSTNVDESEVDAVHREVCLHDACRALT